MRFRFSDFLALLQIRFPEIPPYTSRSEFLFGICVSVPVLEPLTFFRHADEVWHRHLMLLDANKRKREGAKWAKEE